MICQYGLTLSLVIDNAHHQLKCARRKIFDSSLPRRLKIVTYLRLCCSAIQVYRLAGYPIVPEFDNSLPYLALLNRLSGCHPQWWNHCTISPSGQLRSSQSSIDVWLMLVRNFTLFQKALDSDRQAPNRSRNSEILDAQSVNYHVADIQRLPALSTHPAWLEIT